MDSIQEIILSAACPSSAALGQGAVAVHLMNGTSLATFKQTSAPVHGTAAVQTQGGLGGIILSAQPEKPLLNVYSFQKDQMLSRMVLPEKLSCLTVDAFGNYCAGGTHNGHIYLWEISSGILFSSFEAHYRRVSVLRFSQDASVLISGSDDSGVNVWSVARLVDDAVQQEVPTPLFSLSDHTLPITDIICGIGAFPKCRVFTSSTDNSCKIWDLSSRSLLTTFQFPQPISIVALDPSERTFFAASPEGTIHQVNLFRRRKDKLGHREGGMEAIGGLGIADLQRIGQDENAEDERQIVAGEPITALTISITSSNLIIGTSSGNIHIYDIASHQLIKKITAGSHKGFAITHLSTMMKPVDLFGHISLGDTNNGKEIFPIRPISNFQRMKDQRTREEHLVTILLPTQQNGSTIPAFTREEMLTDHLYFMNPALRTSSTGSSLQSRVSELEGEVAKLRSDLTKAKGFNDAMWESVVDITINPDKTAADERQQKRARSSALRDEH